MAITHLKLYHQPGSRSVRVKWILHEVVGDGFEVAPVSLYEGDQYSAEFLELNPNHCVPVLEIGWETGESMRMVESAAMVALLADAFPERRLAPPPDAISPRRVDYLQMLHFASTWMDMMLWQVRVHEHLLPEAERDARTVARYRKKMLDEVEPQLAARLERHACICGEAFSAADCIVGHNVLWARAYGMCQAPVFRRYLSRVSKRPAFSSAFAGTREFSLVVPEGALLTQRFTG